MKVSKGIKYNEIKYDKFNNETLSSINTNGFFLTSSDFLADNNWDTYAEIKLNDNNNTYIDFEFKEIYTINAFSLSPFQGSDNLLIHKFIIKTSIDGIQYEDIGEYVIDYEFNNENKKEHAFSFKSVNLKYLRIEITDLTTLDGVNLKVNQIKIFHTDATFNTNYLKIINLTSPSGSSETPISNLTDNNNETYWESDLSYEVNISFKNLFRYLELKNASNIKSPISIKYSSSYGSSYSNDYDIDDVENIFIDTLSVQSSDFINVTLTFHPIEQNIPITIGEMIIKDKTVFGINIVEHLVLAQNGDPYKNKEKNKNQKALSSFQFGEKYVFKDDVIEVYAYNGSEILMRIIGSDESDISSVISLNQGLNILKASNNGIIYFSNMYTSDEQVIPPEIIIIGGRQVPSFRINDSVDSFKWQIDNRVNYNNMTYWEGRNVCANLSTVNYISLDGFDEFIEWWDKTFELLAKSFAYDFSSEKNKVFYTRHHSDGLGPAFTKDEYIIKVGAKDLDELLGLEYLLYPSSWSSLFISQHEMSHALSGFSLVKGGEELFNEGLAQYGVFIVDRSLYRDGYEKEHISSETLEFANNGIYYPQKSIYQVSSYDRGAIFIQLNLAFGNERMEYLFREIKEQDIDISMSNVDFQQFFIKLSSVLFNYNMLIFYKNWGFEITQNTIEYIDSLQLNELPYNLNEFTQDNYTPLP